MNEPAATHDTHDVVGQIKVAFNNPLPLVIGALIGALVPLATYVVGHAELAKAGWFSVPGAIVVGGCAFSARTVYQWGRRAFDCALKALGFVVLSEGVMTFSTTPWLSVLVLGFLIAINAIANGANLAVSHLEAERRRALARLEAEHQQPALIPVSAPVSAPLAATVVTATPAATVVTATPAATVVTATPAATVVTATPAAPSPSDDDTATPAAPRRPRAPKAKSVKVTKAPRAARATALLN